MTEKTKKMNEKTKKMTEKTKKMTEKTKKMNEKTKKMTEARASVCLVLATALRKSLLLAHTFVNLTFCYHKFISEILLF